MNTESTQRSEILTPEAIAILRRACKKSKTRSAAVRNPRALLARHGIELPNDVELRIYQLKGSSGDKPRRSGPEVAEPLLDGDLTLYGQIRDVPPGLDAWWRSTHQGCPLGTVPYTTKKKVTVCDMWGVAAGPREWVQDVPDTPFGHWTYPNSQEICLLSHEEEVEVTECLPRLTITLP
jgi:hypothetical protein